jgi:hypothetical protein
MTTQQKLNAVFLFFVVLSTVGAALWMAPIRPRLAVWESTSLGAAGGFLFGLLAVLVARSLLRAKGLYS